MGLPWACLDLREWSVTTVSLRFERSYLVRKQLKTKRSTKESPRPARTFCAAYPRLLTASPFAHSGAFTSFRHRAARIGAAQNVRPSLALSFRQDRTATAPQACPSPSRAPLALKTATPSGRRRSTARGCALTVSLFEQPRSLRDRSTPGHPPAVGACLRSTEAVRAEGLRRSARGMTKRTK